MLKVTSAGAARIDHSPILGQIATPIGAIYLTSDLLIWRKLRRAEFLGFAVFGRGANLVDEAEVSTWKSRFSSVEFVAQLRDGAIPERVGEVMQSDGEGFLVEVGQQVGVSLADGT